MQTLKAALPNIVEKAFRFGIIGVSTIALYFLFLNLLAPYFASVAVLAGVCYAITTVYNYAAQSWFTFRKLPQSAQILRRYVVMHLICMAVNSALMALLLQSFEVSLNLAQLGVTVLVAGLSFVLSYIWVYNDS